MAWYDWITGRNGVGRAEMRGLSSDVMTSQQMDQSRPMSAGRVGNGVTAQPAVTASSQRLEQRRTERNAKRELLFQVVRESMVRVGVLSSAFKFKVLSLDQRGRSFLVMIELSADFSGEVEKLAEIETMIAQTAKHRFEIVVQAVYWRYFNASASSTVSSASAPAPLLGAMQAPSSRPAPLFGMEGASSAGTPSAPMAALSSAPFASEATQALPIIGATAAQKISASQSVTRPAVPAVAVATAGSDELSDDEVAAFRRALAAGAAQGAMAAPSAAIRSGPTAAIHAAVAAPLAGRAAPNNSEKARSKLLLTGYEDTEMVDDDPMPALSGTQYGELR
jgi:hypothetical protein